MKTATAFAPATVANVAVGFDILGFALEKIGETATLQQIRDSRDVVLDPVEGFPNLPSDPRQNTAAAGLLALIEDRGLDFGFRVKLKKSIPIGSGLGGSSTSAVASIVAANSFLKKKLSKEELLHYALIGEEVASRSRHADNVAPCLQGGLVLVRGLVETVQVKTPDKMRCVVILPRLSINTKDARSLLTPEVPLKKVIEQTANLAGFLLGCTTGKMPLIKNSLRDVLIEPQRAKLIPHFHDFQRVAMANGALGCSISGSGPAIFALTPDARVAARVHRALLAEARARDIALSGSWTSRIARKGAHLVRETR